MPLILLCGSISLLRQFLPVFVCCNPQKNKERKFIFFCPWSDSSYLKLPWWLSEWRKDLTRPSFSLNVEGSRMRGNIEFSLKQKSALTWKPVCGSGGCLWNIQRGNTLQDAGVLAHSGGSSPFFYNLRFSFPPPGNIQQQAPGSDINTAGQQRPDELEMFAF